MKAVSASRRENLRDWTTWAAIGGIGIVFLEGMNFIRWDPLLVVTLGLLSIVPLLIRGQQARRRTAMMNRNPEPIVSPTLPIRRVSLPKIGRNSTMLKVTCPTCGCPVWIIGNMDRVGPTKYGHPVRHFNIEQVFVPPTEPGPKADATGVV